MSGGEGIQKVKTGYGTPGAVGLAILMGEHERGPAGAVDHT